MNTFIEFEQIRYKADLDNPLDISIPLRSGSGNPNAFGIQHPLFEPFRTGSFIAAVASGAPVNCENLLINPHGNGTHTECIGHITKDRITINQTLTRFFFIARLITAELTRHDQDEFVSLESVEQMIRPGIDALLIRTRPNTEAKLTALYSGNYPPYLQPELCKYLCDQKVRHLLVDLPSVDPEKDNGALAAHKAFWGIPHAPRLDATISEMIFVPDHVSDGLYLLNIQIAPVESDASPSKPVLYTLQPEN